MAKETKKYDEDYLNGLIAKAKKSWEGVDVDSFISELRDDLTDKEVVEKLSKEVTSHIIEQIKSNMNTITVKCRDLMVGDWVTNEHGLPAQIINVDNLCAFTIFGGNEDDEGEPWVFDDKDCQPCAIEITEELLEANGWDVCRYKFDEDDIPLSCDKEEKGNCLEWVRGTLSIWIAYEENSDGAYPDILIPCKYVHQLQQVLRLAGMTELANNFKVK